jgi:hypothetical protein
MRGKVWVIISWITISLWLITWSIWSFISWGIWSIWSLVAWSIWSMELHNVEHMVHNVEHRLADMACIGGHSVGHMEHMVP